MKPGRQGRQQPSGPSFSVAAGLLIAALAPSLPAVQADQATPTPGVTPSAAASSTDAATEEAIPPKVSSFCGDLRGVARKYGWKKLEPCGTGIAWKSWGDSVRGRPLVYAEFGDPHATNTTLVLTLVHGDEVTPLYLGLELAQWLQAHRGELSNLRVIVAPVVNPDGLFWRPPTRMNARGVDVNRNFRTRDWKQKALVAWKSKYRSDPRRFPGSAPSSEPETVFQEDLIKIFRPQKILSVHSPLNFMDYDGPSSLSLAKFPRDYVQECLKLRAKLKAKSEGFYPGSLGNYAGQELGIPTLTLELPTSDPRKADAYWRKFQEGIRTMIQFAMPNYASRAEAAPES